MDAGEAGSRQSRVTSTQNHSRYDLQTTPQPSRREPQERQHEEAPAMATATLLRPSAPYSQPHSQPHSYSPGYPNAPAPSNKSDMISPIEPRRASDPADAPQHRQSLPSISEVISSAGSPVGSLSQPPPPISIPSFPSPFSASPRPYSDPHTGHDKGPSTHPLHPPPTYPSRQEPLPPFGDSSRAHHPFASRPGPSPLHSFSPPHPSPPTKPEQPRLESDSIADQHAMNGGYRHPPPIAPYSTTGQLAPGQLPQPSPYPLSPRHAGPPVHSPFDPQRGPPPRQEEGEDARARYEMPLNRHIEAWTYQECLSRIASSSRTIFNFAEGYGKIAQEQHTSRPIPERLPTEREVTDMLGNLDYIRRSLENVRDLVQQSTRAEIPREVPAKAPFEEEDVQMYEGIKQPPYGGATTEVKKRRGRAAPPGRCHSCNRIDTPEWRRGPDGARTLCNACGLHYAKLERKRQLEARNRPARQGDEAS